MLDVEKYEKNLKLSTVELVLSCPYVFKKSNTMSMAILDEGQSEQVHSKTLSSVTLFAFTFFSTLSDCRLWLSTNLIYQVELKKTHL